MKEIIDTIIIILFVIILFNFIRGFNKQQVEKHKKLLEEKEKRQMQGKEND